MLDIMVVEDDLHFRQRFADAIADCPSMRVVACCSTVRDALAALRQVVPDVLLVDLGLPDGSGIQVIRAAHAQHAACDILVVTVFGDQDNVLASIEAGATGYLLKDDSNENYIERIRELHGGGSPISPIIARQLLRRLGPAQEPGGAPPGGTETMSEREIEVLNLLARGFNYQEIAELLNVSKNTIATYVKRIYRKLSVNSRSEAVFEARQLGILS